ncbi:MAG: aspartyl protease family protein [Holophaga sp.]|nr:aspartyl protease family protein [Holophaga sp.]
MVRGRSLLLAGIMGCGLWAQGAFEARIAEFEIILNRHYRGERLEEARARSNRDVDAFNARSKALNAELAEARARLEKAQSPAQATFAELQKLDAELKASIPDGADKAGNAKYQARIATRNVLAKRVLELNAEAQRILDEHNAFATQGKAELDRLRSQVLADQEALDKRQSASDQFVKSGEDLAFFQRVNGLLAELRGNYRKAPRPDLTLPLEKVRRIRRELAVWAMAGQERNPKGLVVVEALVADEPCWLIVDSGATETILSQELVEAVGMVGAQSEVVSLVVVGGLRLQGRQFRIPQLTVAGQTQRDVSASAVRPAEVGLDGLLGQSFLKTFVYTIDERTPGKLILSRR